MQISMRRYLLLSFITLSLMAGCVVALNRAIDPFWYYRDVSIEGVNEVKPKFGRYERHVKPAIVRREQPASLIFGSSFAEVGFDPLHPALNKDGAGFNLALAGSPWSMVVCHAKFALKHDRNLRRMVVGIHPEAMPKQDCAEDISRMENLDERAFLFSYDAFEASINTIREQRRNKHSHTAQGLYFYTRGLRGTSSRFKEFFTINPICRIGRVSAYIPEEHRFRNAGKLDLSGLKELVGIVESKGIELKLVIYPRHAMSFEREYQCGNRHRRWDAVEEIVGGVEAMHVKNVEIWDFEGYHSIGLEPISDAPGIYWQDPEHFNYEFGNIMLDEMFGLQPSRWGSRLSMETIPGLFEKEKMLRKTYIEKHPEFLQNLKMLLPDHYG